MLDYKNNLRLKIHHVATAATQNYARDILMVGVLTEQILQEWSMQGGGDEEPSYSWLKDRARRLCSRAVYEAWRSEEPEMRERAFTNLRRYLEYKLNASGYATILQKYDNAIDDVLHLALEEIYVIRSRASLSGPREPEAFLCWAYTIVRCHAYKYVQRRKKNDWESLDAQREEFAEQWEDTSNPDPHDYVVKQELQQTLEEAIRSLRNPRYQQVLWYTFLYGMTEGELAEHLHVHVQEVYLRKFRALKALRKNTKVMERLRSMLE